MSEPIYVKDEEAEQNRKFWIGVMALVLLPLLLFVGELVIIGVSAWKWGQKRGWTKYDRLNALLATVCSIFLATVGFILIGYTFRDLDYHDLPIIASFFSNLDDNWFRYMLNGSFLLNLFIFSVSIIICPIFCFIVWSIELIKWFSTPSGHENQKTFVRRLTDRSQATCP